jgi:hypothetical protein
VSIIAIVECDTIKLPVHLPDGTKVEIVLPVEAEATEEPCATPAADDPFYRLAELAEPMGQLTNEEIDAAVYDR